MKFILSKRRAQIWVNEDHLDEFVYTSISERTFQNKNWGHYNLKSNCFQQINYESHDEIAANKFNKLINQLILGNFKLSIKTKTFRLTLCYFYSLSDLNESDAL